MWRKAVARGDESTFHQEFLTKISIKFARWSSPHFKPHSPLSPRPLTASIGVSDDQALSSLRALAQSGCCR